MTTELAKAEQLSSWMALQAQAEALLKSNFLPAAIQTPEQAIAIIQTGRELGIGPMQSLRAINIIQGKPTMSAELIAGLVHSKVPGAVLRVAETTDKVCRVEAARPGQEPTVITWTMDDAKRANLTGKDNWKKFPRAMLRSRAIAEAARAVFPDATMGLYDPDELGAETEGAPIVMDATTSPAYDGVPQDQSHLEFSDPKFWHEKITEAEDEADLGEVGNAIADLRFEDWDRAGLRKHYANKLRKIQANGSKPLSEYVEGEPSEERTP